MALGSGPVPDGTMTTGESSGHLDQHDPGSGVALGCQQDHRLWFRPWTSTQTLAALQAMDINTDQSRDRTAGPEMVLIGILDSDDTMAPDCCTDH